MVQVQGGTVPVEMDHLGMWFADAADAVNAGCPGTVTPFDGDHQAGIQVWTPATLQTGKDPFAGSNSLCLDLPLAAELPARRFRCSFSRAQ